MAVITEPLIQEVVRLHEKGKYEEILDTFYNVISGGNQKDKTTLRLLLWPAPTVNDLIVLNGFIISRSISHVYSVGCGTGLLEWLLLQTNLRYSNQESQREDVQDAESISSSADSTENPETLLPSPSPSPSLALTGIEVDSQWWTSKYAPPLFLPRRYVGEDFPPGVPFGTEGDLLIFSYFNNITACTEYLKLFRGTYVVIIGPTQKQYCAPNPLDLKTNSDYPISEWNMVLLQRFGLEPFDYIAIYSKATEDCL